MTRGRKHVYVCARKGGSEPTKTDVPLIDCARNEITGRVCCLYVTRCRGERMENISPPPVPALAPGGCVHCRAGPYSTL